MNKMKTADSSGIPGRSGISGVHSGEHSGAQVHTFAICAYQESPYLEECILSCLHQSVPGEVIIATSTPNQHIRDLAGKYHLRLYVRGKQPLSSDHEIHTAGGDTDNGGYMEKGIGHDWNFALNCARTKLVTIAHQDDLYHYRYREKIQEAAGHCRHPLILFTDYGEKRGDGIVTVNRLLCVKRFLLMPLVCRCMWRSIFVRRRILSLGSAICCPAVTVAAENVPQTLFENNMKSNIDWQAWERISRLEGEFAYVPRPLVLHRIHAASTTSQLLDEDGRKAEDLLMYRKFWPQWIAQLIERFYQSAEKSNRM